MSHQESTTGWKCAAGMLLGSLLLAGAILHSDVPERARQCFGRLANSAMETLEKESYAQRRQIHRVHESEWVRGE